MPQTSVAAVVGSAKINVFHLKAAAICALLMITDGYDLVSFGTVIPHLMKDWGTDPVTLASLLGFGTSRTADVLVISAIGVFALITLPLALRGGAAPLEPGQGPALREG